MQYTAVLVLLLIACSSCDQAPLIPSTSFVEVGKSTTYDAVLYYGDSDEECFLDDDEEGTGEGIMFEDSIFVNYCLHYRNSYIYFSGVNENGAKTLLLRVGDGTASIEVSFKSNQDKLKVEVGEEYDTGMDTDQSEKIDVPMILSIYEAKETWGSTYAVDVYWMFDEKEVTEYVEEGDVEKGSTECFTPEMGRLEGLEICCEFTDDKEIVISVEGDLVVGIYDEDNTGNSISFIYQNVDDMIYLTREDAETSIFYVVSTQVMWVGGQGTIEENDNNNVIEMTLTNADDDDDGYTWECINVYNPANSDSVLYQQVQILCGICNEDDEYCAIRVYMRDQKPQTITAFEYLEDVDLNIEYDGTIEKVTVTYGDISFYFWADEWLIYSIEGDNGFSFRPFIGDINFVSDGGDEYDLEADYEYDADGFIEDIDLLGGDDDDAIFDIWCEEDACYLGDLDEDTYEFSVAKYYNGEFETVRAYYIDQDDDTDQANTCLSFENTDGYILNDCGFNSQWEMYFHTFLIVPVDTIQLSEDDVATLKLSRVSLLQTSEDDDSDSDEEEEQSRESNTQSNQQEDEEDSDGEEEEEEEEEDSDGEDSGEQGGSSSSGSGSSSGKSSGSSQSGGSSGSSSGNNSRK